MVAWSYVKAPAFNFMKAAAFRFQYLQNSICYVDKIYYTLNIGFRPASISTALWAFAQSRIEPNEMLGLNIIIHYIECIENVPFLYYIPCRSTFYILYSLLSGRLYLIICAVYNLLHTQYYIVLGRRRQFWIGMFWCVVQKRDETSIFVCANTQKIVPASWTWVARVENEAKFYSKPWSETRSKPSIIYTHNNNMIYSLFIW